MARPRAQDYETKRRAIREAAAALFAAHGFRIERQVQLPLLIWVFTLAAV